jgi:hypothetical protein
MTMGKFELALCVLFLLAVPAVCWSAKPPQVRREIHFPDLPGGACLKCDLHMHTVFSDGKVWPTVRVDEVWREGLDVMAITDHIEHQPHKDDVPTNHNRSYELAQRAAKAHKLLLIRGTEITRDTPPGHFNAVFLDDIDPLDTPGFLDSVRQAKKQGAFIFWNHHAWKGEKRGSWRDVHTTMYNEKCLRGMEVANGGKYYPSAHKWCLEKNLTMIGNTDIHEPDHRYESTSADHRTMTLVFAKQRTVAGVKEALEAGRTIVWFKDQLIGREKLLRPFCEACIRVKQPNLRTKKKMFVEVCNTCQADITLEPDKGAPIRPVALPALSTVLLQIPVKKSAPFDAIKCKVKNFLVAPGKSLTLTLKIPESKDSAKVGSRQVGGK